MAHHYFCHLQQSLLVKLLHILLQGRFPLAWGWLALAAAAVGRCCSCIRCTCKQKMMCAVHSSISLLPLKHLSAQAKQQDGRCQCTVSNGTALPSQPTQLNGPTALATSYSHPWSPHCPGLAEPRACLRLRSTLQHCCRILCRSPSLPLTQEPPSPSTDQEVAHPGLT